jgi:carbon-monoxide dehydrogenase small subunit
MKTPIQFRLNGEDVAAFVDSGANLLDVLRESVGDLSVKGGCWQGTCGTCTVLIDGAPRVSCVTLAEGCAAAPICIRCKPPSWSALPPSAAIARRAC